MEDPPTYTNGSGSDGHANGHSTDAVMRRGEDVVVEGNGTEGGGGGSCRQRCFGIFYLGGMRTAQGYNVLGMARGALVMSNVFLSTSFIYLASEEAGCLDEEGDVDDECDHRVHGQKPAALIANIAVIAGVLSALFMPLIGAMVDYTSHRRTVGILAAAFITLIQTVQIGTVSSTWFVMAILQALAGFIYQIEVLSSYAYLPEIARLVGAETTNKYASIFVMCQFGSQTSFLLTVIVLSFALGWSENDVWTGQLSQLVNAIWIFVTFTIGWRRCPSASASHVLPDNRSLFNEGFHRMFQTSRNIHRRYGRSMQWYLLTVVCAEAGVNAFTVVSVTYLNEKIGLSGIEIGIFFLVTLIFSLPGTVLSTFVTKRTDPTISYRLSMLATIVVSILGAFLLKEEWKEYSYIWGVFVGVCIGWFYPVEDVLFSRLLPKGQEAEFSGFFIYCSQIIVWLPPLIFAVMVENDVDQKFGVAAVTAFLAIGIVLMSMAAPWDEMLVEMHGNPDGDDNDNNNNNDDDDDDAVDDTDDGRKEGGGGSS